MIVETTSFAAVDGLPVQTHLARPDGAGPFPAIVMCYEFWGMLDVPGGGPHMRDVASRFAREGYVAVVPDYYATRGQQPTMEGGTIKGSPPEEEVTRDLKDCIRWLQQLPFVRGDRIGAIGWCGGGRQSLLLAANCPDLRAVASFYGRLTKRPGNPAPGPIDLAPRMRCPVFGAYGEKDHAILVETAHEFEAALERDKVPHEIHIYPEAGHAFMNDQRDGYNAPAAEDAWQALTRFFAGNLK